MCGRSGLALIRPSSKNNGLPITCKAAYRDEEEGDYHLCYTVNVLLKSSEYGISFPSQICIAFLPRSLAGNPAARRRIQELVSLASFRGLPVSSVRYAAEQVRAIPLSVEAYCERFERLIESKRNFNASQIKSRQAVRQDASRRHFHLSCAGSGFSPA
jgi:hypothetical protein